MRHGRQQEKPAETAARPAPIPAVAVPSGTVAIRTPALSWLAWALAGGGILVWADTLTRSIQVVATMVPSTARDTAYGLSVRVVLIRIGLVVLTIVAAPVATLVAVMAGMFVQPLLIAVADYRPDSGAYTLGAIVTGAGIAFLLTVRIRRPIRRQFRQPPSALPMARTTKTMSTGRN